MSLNKFSSHLQCIIKSLFGSFVRFPSFYQVDGESHVVTENPIIREELVHNFPHFSRLWVENVWTEVQTHKQHWGLIG